MKNKTVWIEDYVYEATNEIGNRIRIDMREANKKTGLSPMELVQSALSGCVAVEIVLMLKKKRKNVVDFYIESEGSRNETFPKYFKVIDLIFVLLSDNTSPEELRKVVDLSLDKYCSVASSLKAEINASVKVLKP